MVASNFKTFVGHRILQSVVVSQNLAVVSVLVTNGKKTNAFCSLLKEQIQNLAAEIEAVKTFMKEQLFLLKKTQKDKSDEEEHSSENSELVKLLRQQNASLLEENASKNEIIKKPSQNISTVNKNMCDKNSKPEEKYQTVKRKSVTKGNEKLFSEISCKNRYETLYLMDSDDANITEDTGNTSSTDDECCFDKKKE